MNIEELHGIGFVCHDKVRLSQVEYALTVDWENERMHGEIRVVDGVGGNLLVAFNKPLMLNLSDGQRREIMLEQPVDRFRDKWAVVGSRPLQAGS